MHQYERVDESRRQETFQLSTAGLICQGSMVDILLNLVIFSTDLTLEGSIILLFQRLGAATEKLTSSIGIYCRNKKFIRI